jgi:hypothetical protein
VGEVQAAKMPGQWPLSLSLSCDCPCDRPLLSPVWLSRRTVSRVQGDLGPAPVYLEPLL